MNKQPGKFKFVLIFGIIFSIPLAMNYYVCKLLILFLFRSFTWNYSLIELSFVLIASILFGVLFGTYVQRKRTNNVNV